MPVTTPANTSLPSLEERVMKFLGGRVGAENIDRMALTPEQQAGEKADFLLEKRTVVCEVKSLQTDTKEKIDRLLEPLLKSEQAPVFYGEWELEKILKHFPDGEAIQRKIYEATTSAVWRLFRKANDQIHVTKQTFGLPQAGGALVLVNELVGILAPNVLAYRLNELFGKRDPDGRFTYAEIDAVWMISETHRVDIGQGQESVVSFVLFREDNSAAAVALDRMQKPWAAIHGMPYVEMNPELFNTLKFKEAGQEPQPHKISMQDRWVLEYRQKPYLRNHTTGQLQEYFQKLFSGLSAGALKGASAEESKLFGALMERFSHFLEEVRERGLDMRTFSPAMQGMGDAFRQGQRPKADLDGIAAMAKASAGFEAGRYYTNALGKNYRCLKTERDTATLLLIDMVAGKTLEITLRIKLTDSKKYWPIYDLTLLEALERRYVRWASLHQMGFNPSTG